MTTITRTCATCPTETTGRQKYCSDCATERARESDSARNRENRYKYAKAATAHRLAVLERYARIKAMYGVRGGFAQTESKIIRAVKL